MRLTTRFFELTDAEILLLTDEQIARHIDRECAEEGAPLLPPDPGPAPVKPSAQADITVYLVDGTECSDAVEAQRLADLLNRTQRLNSQYVSASGVYEQVARAETSYVTVLPAKRFSAAAWDAVKDEFSRFGEEQKRYEKDVKEFNAASKERERITQAVREKVAEVHDAERTRVRFVGELTRYVELANGDEEMARRFLLKAHPEAEKHLPPLEPVALPASSV